MSDEYDGTEPQSRVWFMRTSPSLCWGLFGTAGDEYGRKTWYVNLVFWWFVVASRDVRFPDPENEILRPRKR